MYRSSLRRSVTALLSSFLLTVVGLHGSPATAAPSSGGSVFASTSVNLGQTLVFLGWMSYCNRYERQESVIVISPGKSKVKAFTCDFTTGGTSIPFGVDTTLTLTFDGTPVATAAVKAADTAVTFDVDLTAVNEGWYMASITGGLVGPWSILDYGIYVLKGATAQPHALMPVTTASHELMFEGGGLYQQAWVPTKFAPVTVPYPAGCSPTCRRCPRARTSWSPRSPCHGRATCTGRC